MKRQAAIDPPSFEPYFDLISRAISEVDDGFFKLATTYEPSGIVRERAFCYELYHQIRNQMDENDPLSLNGEIDKRGHIDFAKEDWKNPDFVFHIPGTHLGNTIAIEVKGTLGRKNNIIEDFATLLTFTERYGYQVGLFILYNHTYDEFRDEMRDLLYQFSARPTIDSIYILTISSQGGALDIEKLSSLFG